MVLAVGLVIALRSRLGVDEGRDVLRRRVRGGTDGGGGPGTLLSKSTLHLNLRRKNSSNPSGTFLLGMLPSFKIIIVDLELKPSI